MKIKFEIVVIAFLALFSLFLAIAYVWRVNGFANAVVPETKIIPDAYASEIYPTIEIGADGVFREYGDQILTGNYRQKRNKISLMYSNGSIKELCSLFGSQQLVAIEGKCSCGYWIIEEKECMKKVYFRRGVVPSSLYQ